MDSRPLHYGAWTRPIEWADGRPLYHEIDGGAATGQCVPLLVATEGYVGFAGLQPIAMSADGYLSFPVVDVQEWPINAFSGPGKLDPYADAFRWQHHREDDEIMAIISAFLSVN